ncbi:MAG: hypothetical protein CFE23_14145 [Flavobacterium sp. BFFFF1]|uniref:DUF4199 domain-containing protein n=1 Tax=unclassified Flavobacterium TaxID=196869 RepID=UPI000BC9AD9F|nr:MULTISPECIES: DUF4199 domain-containing protein [unclassified Flavobacterium]OYU79436.1 MAG: hypothetical protein CFE23_14145 [Flavobacterium sp. BFFFF1]
MKKFAIEIKWAIRYIFVFLAWVFLEKYCGAYDENVGSYFLFSFGFYIFAFLIYLMALKDKKEHYFSNQLEWKQGTVSGIYMTVFIAILMPVAQIIIQKAIAPEFFPNMIKHSLASKNANAQAIREYFSFPDYITHSIFLALSVGMIYAAAASAVLKTKALKSKP